MLVIQGSHQTSVLAGGRPGRGCDQMSHSVLVVGGRYRPPARFCDRFHAHTNIDFPLNDLTCPLEKS